jgi:hypothetical protein
MSPTRESIAADKMELLELLHRYCRAIDRRDYDLLRTVYHLDGIDDHGGLYSGSAEDFIVKAVPQGLAPYAITTHQIMNATFKVDGDRAEGESSVLCAHISKDDPLDNTIVSGRYLDKFERRNGEWRILHRKTMSDWSNVPGGLDPEQPQGKTNRDDLSYHFLDMFRT